MTRRTINVQHRHGFPCRVIANDPSLTDVEVIFTADDEADRVLFVSLAVQDELARMLAYRRVCRSNTQAMNLSQAAETAIEGLVALRLEHHGDPDALNAAIQAVVDELAANRRTAMDLRPARESSAAHGGHHQQPRINHGEQAHV